VTLGFTLAYLVIIVLVPLSGLFFSASALSLPDFWKAVTSSRVLQAYKISFGLSFIAALVNTFFGLILAWVLARYRFPLKKVVDAMVDLPFALPTAVAGIALTALYGPQGWIGGPLEAIGIKVAFTPLGILIALMFVGLPFIVRTVEPILQDLDKELEEAALSLGATRWQTFWHVTLPNIKWGLIYGVILCNARAMGEFGAVSVVSGHIRGQTNTLPLHIEILYNEYQFAAAFAVASLLALLALVTLLLKYIIEQRVKAQKRAASDRQ
jgi:sulfate transport system permease protein